MKKFRVTGITVLLLSILILLFFITNKFQEYRYAGSYFLNHKMNEVNNNAFMIIRELEGTDEFTVEELLNIYEQENNLVSAYADILYSLKLEKNSKILNPTELNVLVPLNDTNWWNKKEDKELVLLTETEKNHMNTLLNLSKTINQIFKDFDNINVETATPSISKKIITAISEEASTQLPLPLR